MNWFVCSHLNNKHYQVSTILECKDFFLSETYGQNLKTQMFSFHFILNIYNEALAGQWIQIQRVFPSSALPPPPRLPVFYENFVVAGGVSLSGIYLYLPPDWFWIWGRYSGNIPSIYHPRLPRAGVHTVRGVVPTLTTGRGGVSASVRGSPGRPWEEGMKRESPHLRGGGGGLGSAPSKLG